jgi:transcription-repair coupling factor (superfamily II helicase)
MYNRPSRMVGQGQFVCLAVVVCNQRFMGHEVALQDLARQLTRDPWIHGLSQRLRRVRASRPAMIHGLPGAQRLATIAALVQSLEFPVMIVTSRPDVAEQIAGGLREYLGDDSPIDIWPGADATPYELVPLDRAVSVKRVEILQRLGTGERSVTAVPARALTQRLSPSTDFLGQVHELRVGARLQPETFLADLITSGYDIQQMVREPGQVSRRGGIIDLFPPTGDHAVRIDLFGDEIDSLRLFDPETQRSTNRIERFSVRPPLEISLLHRAEAVRDLQELELESLRPEVREEWGRLLRRLENADPGVALDLFSPYLLPNPAMMLDHLPMRHLVIAVEPGAIQLALNQFVALAEETRANLIDAGEIPAGMRQPYVDASEALQRLRGRRLLTIGEPPDEWGIESIADIPGAPGFSPSIASFAGRGDAWVRHVVSLAAEGWNAVIATEQSERVSEMLREHDFIPQQQMADHDDGLSSGAVMVRHSSVQPGWINPGLRLALFTDRELFGYRHHVRSRPRRRRQVTPGLIESLRPGDYVVHVEHGIARYAGLTTLESSGAEREYLLLEYAANDRLYLPVDQIDRITRYEGGGVEPKLTRLGSPEWSRAKQRVRRAVREMAFELLQLYAAREASEGVAFPPDTVWDFELEESFPYRETVDQRRAILDVKGDMENSRPMDRLVCGDVGYGKTEVALRAAFKAVNGGYQVAILVPTTILALQHYHTFRERLAAFPVNVAMLSRLRTRREQRGTLDGLASGNVDIVIGTHRLLQKDVRFSQLGMVVVDEEQRFGVAHKEQLKRLRTDVDVLTMTATPIPRTLHMALAGIRDLSVINTPPQDRISIRTFVTAESDSLVRESILREIGRGGQVYFVHNRVQSIYHVLRKLLELVPEARFGVGHGQMPEDELEAVMLAFVQHEFDVLICTTIIESGVDIPNTNTVIIDQAQNFGLTQLYQLRGRIGRSHQRAYAYLLYPPNRTLSREAQARLEAIQEATELGAGFQIALRDLEIRGAGNVLGAEQSGHIAAVGFDLYTRMLATAVEEIKSGRPIEEPESVTVDLQVDAVIPPEYAGDEELRIELYRKLAAVESHGQLRDLQEEFLDRFGPIPAPVYKLIELARLRVRAAGLGVTSIIERDREVYIRPVVGSRLNQEQLRIAIGAGVHVTPNQVRLTTARIELDSLDAVKRVLSAVEDGDATVFSAAG